MEYKEKFIVINRKRLAELNEVSANNMVHNSVSTFISALKDLRISYESDVGRAMDQKYFVCNQDEPYAIAVFRLIENHEDHKQHLSDALLAIKSRPKGLQQC